MKYKICPHCGKQNSPTALDCEECFTSLFAVRVTDDENEKALQANDAHVGRTVRVCEACGYVNPANARKCQSCHEDISDIIPTEEKESLSMQFSLVSDDGYTYAIPQGKTVIGREAVMSDYLQGRDYVSRRHAELTLECGKLTLLNLSHTNYTYINSVRYISETVEIHDGDTIFLGDSGKNKANHDKAAFFTVRSIPCT